MILCIRFHASPPFQRARVGQRDKRADRERGLALRPDGMAHSTSSCSVASVRELRQRTANLACIQPGEQVLDVGCGTGTLAIEVARCVGTSGPRRRR